MNKDELILRIYDTALDSSAWPDVLQEIAHFCNARGSYVFEMRGDADQRRINAMHYSAIHDKKILNQYLALHRDAELADQEYFAERSRASDKIELIADDELVSLSMADGDIFSRPHMQMQMKYGFKHRTGALLNKDDYFRDRIGIVYGLDYGPAKPADIAAAESILPHLAKALDVTRPATIAREQRDNLAESINHLNVGICILDQRRRTIFRNIEFDRQLDRYDSFRVDRDGRLALNPDRFDRTIIDLFEHHGHHGKYGARPRKEAIASSINDDGEFALCVEVIPLRRADEFGEMHLDGHVIYSLDTSQSYDLRARMISDLYGLSRSETEILTLMAEGLTNPEISDRRTKSIHTVNSQVKSVLAKTQAANRTQLIRLATNLSVGFPRKEAD